MNKYHDFNFPESYLLAILVVTAIFLSPNALMAQQNQVEAPLSVIFRDFQNQNENQVRMAATEALNNNGQLAYLSGRAETRIFRGCFVAQGQNPKLAIFSDDGCNLFLSGPVLVEGQEVELNNIRILSRFGTGQHLPDLNQSFHNLTNFDNHAPAIVRGKEFSLIPGREYYVIIAYSNTVYRGNLDIDGCALYAYDGGGSLGPDRRFDLGHVSILASNLNYITHGQKRTFTAIPRNSAGIPLSAIAENDPLITNEDLDSIQYEWHLLTDDAEILIGDDKTLQQFQFNLPNNGGFITNAFFNKLLNDEVEYTIKVIARLDCQSVFGQATITVLPYNGEPNPSANTEEAESYWTDEDLAQSEKTFIVSQSSSIDLGSPQLIYPNVTIAENGSVTRSTEVTATGSVTSINSESLGVNIGLGSKTGLQSGISWELVTGTEVTNSKSTSETWSITQGGPGTFNFITQSFEVTTIYDMHTQWIYNTGYNVRVPTTVKATLIVSNQRFVAVPAN